MIQSLFNAIEKRSSATTSFHVRCSAVQIYNERLIDLLNPTNCGLNDMSTGGLRLRYQSDLGFYVENLYIYECNNATDLMYDQFIVVWVY